MLHPEFGNGAPAPAPLSVALSVQWPMYGKPRLQQIFVEAFLVERVHLEEVLLVDVDLHLVDVVEQVSLVRELLVEESAFVAAGVSVVHSSAPRRIEARVTSASRTF